MCLGMFVIWDVCIILCFLNEGDVGNIDYSTLVEASEIMIIFAIVKEEKNIWRFVHFCFSFRLYSLLSQMRLL